MRVFCSVCAVLLCTALVQAAPPEASLTPASVVKALPANEAGPTGTIGARQGGDTCADATVIPGLPYTDTGTTVGYNHDYDEVCPYVGSLSPDVVYSYTPTIDESIIVDLCESGYDTKVFVYQDDCIPGTAIACNDDYCSDSMGNPYRSYLECFDIFAGHTYYIVVDGYGSGSGNYDLIVDTCVPPVRPECPPDSLFSQRPHLPEEAWSAGTSEINVNGSNYRRYESYSVDEDICDIHFWGLSVVLIGAWTPCVDSVGDFEIIFWDDDGTGMPGTAMCTYTGVPSVTATGLYYAGFEMFYYALDLDPCCPQRDGWVSVQGLGDTDCWFLWMSAVDGNGSSWFENNGVFENYLYDLAVCLTPSSQVFDLGDLNCDGVIDAFDIDPFVLALTDPAGYAAAYPNCDRMLADCNGDGVVDAFDIDPFVALLVGP